VRGNRFIDLIPVPDRFGVKIENVSRSKVYELNRVTDLSFLKHENFPKPGERKR